jgi:hypothetical protein
LHRERSSLFDSKRDTRHDERPLLPVVRRPVLFLPTRPAQPVSI